MSDQTDQLRKDLDSLIGKHDSQTELVRRLRECGGNDLYDAQCAEIGQLNAKVRDLQARFGDQNIVIDNINRLRREAQADIDRVSGLLRDVRGRSNRQNNTIASMRADVKVLTDRCANQAVLLAKIRDMANGE